MTNDWASKEYFLATTALSEYWDTNKPLLFLTMACLRYGDAKKYANHDYKVVPDPWKDNHAIQSARDYTEQLYARLLPELVRILNEVHHAAHSERYWEILIGPWLRIYLAVLYDRYTCLRSAYATYPNLKTVCLTHDSYVIAATPEDFSTYLLTDIFNLQVYSVILDYFGTESNKVYANLKHTLAKPKLRPGWIIKCKNSLRKTANRIFLKFGKDNKTLFTDSGVSFLTLLKIFFKSKFQIVPMTHFEKAPSRFTIDWQKRRQFLNINITQSDFENCLIESLPYFIPAAFIETHSALCQLGDKLTFKPATIFSAMGWHYNEAFKRMAARHQEEGGLLIGHQHGGDYGILAYHTSEMHEKKVTDRYYTWGWNEEKNNTPRAFYGLKLRETKLKGRSYKQKNHYLYGTANGRRFLLRFNYSISAILQYFAFQQQFITALPVAIQDKLRIRLYPSDWGWDRDLRWQEMNVKLHFQSAKIPFTKALSTCELYIADHISTTFAESLAINKPTLIVCDPDMWGIRADAQPYFTELKRVGILHHDPLLGAKALSEINKDISGWWNEPERQKAVELFRNRFCRIASNHLKEWITELK